MKNQISFTNFILPTLLTLALVGCGNDSSSDDSAIDGDGNCTGETVSAFNSANSYLIDIASCQKLNSLLGGRSCTAQNVQSKETMQISYSMVAPRCELAQTLNTTRTTTRTSDITTNRPQVATREIISEKSKSIEITIRSPRSFDRLFSAAQSKDLGIVQSGRVLLNKNQIETDQGFYCMLNINSNVEKKSAQMGEKIKFTKIEYKKQKTQLVLTSPSGYYRLQCLNSGSIQMNNSNWNLKTLKDAFGSLASIKLNR